MEVGTGLFQADKDGRGKSDGDRQLGKGRRKPIKRSLERLEKILVRKRSRIVLMDNIQPRMQRAISFL